MDFFLISFSCVLHRSIKIYIFVPSYFSLLLFSQCAVRLNRSFILVLYNWESWKWWTTNRVFNHLFPWIWTQVHQKNWSSIKHLKGKCLRCHTLFDLILIVSIKWSANYKNVLIQRKIDRCSFLNLSLRIWKWGIERMNLENFEVMMKNRSLMNERKNLIWNQMRRFSFWSLWLI